MRVNTLPQRLPTRTSREQTLPFRHIRTLFTLRRPLPDADANVTTLTDNRVEGKSALPPAGDMRRRGNQKFVPRPGTRPPTPQQLWIVGTP